MSLRLSRVGPQSAAGGRFDFGALNNVSSATPRYLYTGGGYSSLTTSPVFYPIGRALSITEIVVAQIPGFGSAVWRYEIYVSTSGGAFVATGQFVDVANTAYSGAQTLGSAVVCALGDRVGLTSSLLSGTVASGATTILTSLHYE